MKALKIILASIKKADEDYNLINDNDKIVIGISGGKDSMVLLYTLSIYKKYSHKKFELIPAIIDLGFPAFNIENVKNYIKSAMDLDLVILDGKTVYPILATQKELQHTPHLPCSICSKMKKAIINKYAKEIKANKVSFAHHQDDAIETLFLNEMYGGRISTFSPKMLLENDNIVFIRPLVYTKESTIKRCVKEENIIIEKSNCPNDGVTKRAEIKDILTSIYKTFPQADDNFLSILTNYTKEDLFYSHFEKQINSKGLYYKKLITIEDYNSHLKYLNSACKSYSFSKKFNKKDYTKEYYCYYKNNIIKGSIELNIKDRELIISNYKYQNNDEFILFLFRLYKDYFLKINPLKLYIYTNDIKNLEILNLSKINKDLYLVNINPIHLEKLLKKITLIR